MTLLDPAERLEEARDQPAEGHVRVSRRPGRVPAEACKLDDARAGTAGVRLTSPRAPRSCVAHRGGLGKICPNLTGDPC